MFYFRASPGIEDGEFLCLSMRLSCICVCACVCLCGTYKREVWCILAQQSGEDSLSLDALLIFEHIAVHETIQHGGVGMNINIKLQTNSLMGEKREDGNKRKQRERDTESR